LASRLKRKIHLLLEKRLPEQRLFLRSDQATRYVRLKSSTQAAMLAGGGAFVAWTILATAVLLMDFVGTDSVREQAQREREIYETRLNELALARDARAEEAQRAQDRFYVALEQVSTQQEELLASEDRRRELETGIEVIQKTLRRTIRERDTALERVAALETELAEVTGATGSVAGRNAELANTLDVVAAALTDTAAQRDGIAAEAMSLAERVDSLQMQARLTEERNNRIFSRLEEAVSVSLEPLEKMFESAGIPADKLIEDVRRSYSGQGGPLTPISYSTKGTPPDATTRRVNALLGRLDEINLYRLAVDRAPLDFPVKAGYRFTSGYGPRNGRMHEGIDLASPHGTGIHTTADGVVTFAGWLSGYGKLVKIRHSLGYETRYGHMSRIRVKVGQRVSRGDRIGDMGNTGRSTGTHLHYEVRVGGKAVNPMTYIKAARNVFQK